uniref:60S ribosomal protein L20 n=1 Tax=Metchnikovella dogieli TaxID=2804710 RepID=A0A896WP97_9MICR|nr:60S ribosomal protein L18A [Metchnikovella dogieli]
MKEFNIIGKKAEGEDQQLYKMTIFASNTVVAKTRFFKAMRKTNKIKRSAAEIVSLEELKENGVLKARTYGVWIRVSSKNNPKNLYKEYRETSRIKAAAKCFQSLASLYKLRYHEVDIISMKELGLNELKREETRQFAEEGVRFPNVLPMKSRFRHEFVLKKE